MLDFALTFSMCFVNHMTIAMCVSNSFLTKVNEMRHTAKVDLQQQN